MEKENIARALLLATFLCLLCGTAAAAEESPDWTYTTQGILRASLSLQMVRRSPRAVTMHGSPCSTLPEVSYGRRMHRRP